MPSPEIRRAALGLLADMAVSAQREDAEQALGWVAVVVDLESGNITVHGVFDTELAALTWIDKFDPAVNAGLPEGEPGWRSTVRPLLGHADL